MAKRIVSACLVGCACRYDGKSVPDSLLKAMFEAGDLVAVCPEELGGLATPRNPAEIVSEKPFKICTEAGSDVTAEYGSGANQVLGIARVIGAKRAILKSKSPSCGSGQIYDGSFQGKLISGMGATTRVLRAAGMDVINEEEAREEFLSACTRILLLRHAESVFSQDDRVRGLSERGAADAENLAVNLPNALQLNKIYSSPYRRALDTVKPLAEAWDQEIIEDERLRERKVADAPVEDFQSFTAAQWLDHRFCLPGGESLNEVAKRGKEFLLEMEAANRGKTILLSTHGTWMGAVMNAFDPSFDYREWRELQMPDLWEIRFYKGVWVETKQASEEYRG